jgi:gamma-tubulin complex component 5
LDGFEERFHVVGRDALALALRKRLDALEQHRNQHMPEILHLILELADKPAQKSDLGSLDLLLQPDEDAPPKLTWREIAREDGWKEERDIWRFIDYSQASSDEGEPDAKSEAKSEAKTEATIESLTTATSTEDVPLRTVQDSAFKPQGDELLKQIRDSQSWRHASATSEDGKLRKIPISTTQLLRECLFMLAGLETTLFDAECCPVTRYQLAGVSWDAYKALVTSFSECGRKLAPLRAFARTKEELPLLQVFQDSLQKALRSLDQELVTYQGRLVAIEEDVVVSLIGVLVELGPTLTPLYALSDIVRQLQEERNPHAFRYLELLYDAVGISQLQGQRATYRLLGSIFLDCFQVYLKPIRLWMEEGRLLPGDRTFFVSESPTKLPLPQVWKSQFNLLRTPEGQLHAPRFLKPAIDRILAAGKSIVVLNHMKQRESTRQYRAGTEPKMDFVAVCPDELEFAPFSELFSAAFDAWIQSKHHTAAATLRELLFSTYGLPQALDALEHIYLMSDGARSDAFASSIFRHLDNFSSTWKDRFTLTEIAQEAFSACVDAPRLSAELERGGLAHSALASRSSVRLSLPAIRLRYRLSWPIQIVVSDEGIRGYHTIFTFLLQTRRAISILQRPLPNSYSRNNINTDGNSTALTYYLLRTKLLWFCTTLMTYLTTLVLAPSTARLRSELRDAVDLDSMAAAHAAFVSRILSESCQGTKLQPIRECVLDVFDQVIRLEDARKAEAVRREQEAREIERLSMSAVMESSPLKAKVALSPVKGKRRSMGRGRGKIAKEEDEEQDGEEEEEEDDDDGGWFGEKSVAREDEGKPYPVRLREMLGDYERHLRFVASGLRAVARASRDEAAAKWDLLAEMLEVGIRE